MNTIIFTKLGFYEDQMMELNYIKKLLLLVQQRKKKSENTLHKN